MLRLIREPVKKMVKYSKQQFVGINTIIRTPAVQFTPEVYHDLRVSIKKIRSMFELAQFYWGDAARDKYLKRIKKIFDRAGRVRELQLEIDRLKKISRTTRLSKFRSFLTSELVVEQNKFFRAKTRIANALTKRPKNLERCLKELTKNQVEEYLEKRSRKLINKTRSKALGTNQSHQLRKGIKTMHYIQKGAELGDQQNRLLAKADDISDELGKWHDLRVLSQQFKEAEYSIGAGPAETKAIHTLQLRFKRQSKIKLEKLTGVMQSL